MLWRMRSIRLSFMYSLMAESGMPVRLAKIREECIRYA